MSDSIRDLAATIAGLKDQAGRLRAAVVADKGAADGLVQRFQAVGVEGGPVARLSGCAAGHERAVSQLEAIESRLERARFIAMSAISGLHGSGAVARSGNQADDPTSWEKPTPGTELAEAPELRRRGEGLANFFGRNVDKVDDVAKSVGKTIDIAWHSVGHDPTPTTGVVSSAQVPTGPVIQPPSVPKPSAGSVFMAGMVLATLVAKSTQKASAAIKQSRKAES